MNDVGSSNDHATPGRPSGSKRRSRRNRQPRVAPTERRTRSPSRPKAGQTWADFYVEMAIADALFSVTGFTGAETMEGHLRLALRYEPGHPEALNLMAQLCAQTERHGEALDYLRRAMESLAARGEPPDLAARAVIHLAEIYEDRKQYERAIEVYNLGLAWQERAAFYHGRAYCRAKLRDFAGALLDGHRAVELCPDNQAYVNDYGYTLFEAGELEQAREVLRQAVAMNPADDLARNNLRLCEEALRKARGSREAGSEA